ncbi:MAG: pyridoxal phosphate-dependent aminotransferase [Eubacterium sp.]|nr:pyridoxal phosphate-dependent aminotransferase [Eubacterium sp.]
MISDVMRKNVENGSQIRAMFQMGKEMAKEFGEENVYDFSLGNPYTPVPEEFAQAVRDCLDEYSSTELHGYTDNRGYEDVRQAMADNLNKRFGSHYTADNIAMTVGAASGLNAILKTLLNPGEEVIVLCPYFTEYRNYIANYSGVLVEVKCDDNLMPDIADLQAKITAKTKCVIVNTPNNPSGAIYTDEVMKQMAATLEAKQKEFGTDIYIISDEPYRELVYDGAKNPFVPDYYKNTIVGYSFSKSMSIPGERMGYLAIGSDVADFEMMMAAVSTAIRILGPVNAPSLIQKAVAKCLDAQTDVGYYDENRKLLYGSLTEMGYECIKPQGAFYLMVKTPIEEAQFVELARNKYHILVVGTGSFGAPGYVRIAYCCSREKIERSLPAFENMAKELGL